MNIVEINKYPIGRFMYHVQGWSKVIGLFFSFIFSVTCIWGKCLVFGKTLDKMLYFQYILKLITRHASCRSRDPKQWHTLWILKSSFNREVCHWQHLQRICRFIIRVWHATDKHSQTLTDHWLERVSLHHQCCEFYSTKVFPFQPWKIFGADIKKCVCWALLYIRISWKLSQRQQWAPILMATCNKAKSSGWMSQHWMWLLWLPISLRMVRRR